MHPVLEEIARARLPVRPEVFARWQQTIRNEIGPELDRLSAQEAALKVGATNTTSKGAGA